MILNSFDYGIWADDTKGFLMLEIPTKRGISVLE